jgi:hypothetical protein
MGKKRKQVSEQTIFDDNPFLDGFFEWMDSPEGERATEVLDTLLDLMEGVQVDPKQRRFVWPDAGQLNFSNLSNTSRSSALTSVSRRSRGTCCIGLKAATARTTVPSSNWKSLKSSAFNGSLITHDGRLRDNEPRKNSSLSRRQYDGPSRAGI